MTGFSTAAESYTTNGAAVIPCGGADGKHPLVAWRGLSRANAAGRLPEWRQKFADANVGILTGPSKLTVIDVDTPDDALCSDLLGRFGDTPLQARTPRGGWHLFYRSNGEPTKAKLDKLPVDVRGRGGLIVVPPSARNDGARYEFICGTEADINSLPPIKDGALVVQNAPLTGARSLQIIPEGRRNDTLFRIAMVEARSCETIGELESRMWLHNEACKPSLDFQEVKAVVASAWNYTERGQNWVGKEARVYLEVAELEKLIATPEAMALLMALRKAHLGHNDEFAISPRGLASEGQFQGWSERRLRNARERLLELRLLLLKHEGGQGKHDPALFSFPLRQGEDCLSYCGAKRSTKKSARSR
jgi:hypothetical protein